MRHLRVQSGGTTVHTILKNRMIIRTLATSFLVILSASSVQARLNLRRPPTFKAMTSTYCVPQIGAIEPPAPALPTPLKVLVPAARDVNAPSGLPVRMLFDFPVRDPNICRGGDGNYYLVGTTEPEDKHASMWQENDGVRMWRSRDLIHWEAMGHVWTFERDATWSKAWKKSPWVSPNGELRRALWAPEIHFINGTYFIPYSMNYGGTGLLRSTSGKPESPYLDVKTDGPLTDAIDPSLFQDDDGQVYFLWADYNIALMKSDLSGLAEAPRRVQLPSYPWGEGIGIVKVGGKYVFINSGMSDTVFGGNAVKTYDCYSSVADSVYGPYTARTRAIPHAGHNNLFQDRGGQWWSTYFGSGDPYAPWEIKPGVLPVQISPNGQVSARRVEPLPLWRYSLVTPAANWTSDEFKDEDWQQSAAGFGDPSLGEVGPVTHVGTPWKAGEIWMRREFELANAAANPQLFLRYGGDVEIFLNGQRVAERKGSTDDYVFVPLADASALRVGRNIISVHATALQDKPAYVDVGLVDGMRKQ